MFTMVFRRSGGKWVGLCLENGISGQGDAKEQALAKLREAIQSFEDARALDGSIYTSPISIGELHEFLTFEPDEPRTEQFELRAVYA